MRRSRIEQTLLSGAPTADVVVVGMAHHLDVQPRGRAQHLGTAARGGLPALFLASLDIDTPFPQTQGVAWNQWMFFVYTL